MTYEEALTHARRVANVAMDEVLRHCEGDEISDSSTLYRGDAGVALFLAEGSYVLGRADAARVAHRLAHRSLARCESIPTNERYGMYAGVPGVALAAYLIGERLADYRLRNAAARLVTSLSSGVPSTVALDLFNGLAGFLSVVTFLASRGEAIKPSVLNEVEDILTKSCIRDDFDRVSWPNFRGGGELETPRTGLAHGAAGIGLSLLQLFELTGSELARTAYLGATRYEDQYFMQSRANWISIQYTGLGELWSPDFVYWCHGAPGILLNRSYGRSLLSDRSLHEGFAWAERRTATAIESNLSAFDGTLCHGMGGLADVLLLSGYPVASPYITRLVCEIANQLNVSGSLWESRLNPGRSIGLLEGTSGVGYAMLRVLAASTPSVLALS